MTRSLPTELNLTFSFFLPSKRDLISTATAEFTVPLAHLQSPMNWTALLCVLKLCVVPIHKLINGPAYSLLGVPGQLILADSDIRPVKEVGTSLDLLHLPMQ